MKRLLLLLCTLSIASGCFARSIKTVLSNSPGNFDPWNTTRWAEWYDPANPGKLLYRFYIDCDITFATGHDTLATAWCPVKSPNNKDPDLFYIDADGYGCVINGNGQYIDARPAAYRSGGSPGHESITTLYSSPGLTRTGMDTGFYVNQPLNTAKSPVVISNLKLYGFGKGLFTHMNHRQPMIFNTCEFRRNSFPAHIHGGGVTFNYCHFKENYTGIYMDKEAINCLFTGNQFRDNQYQQRHIYGDIEMDSAQSNIFEDNIFQPTTATGGPYYRVGLKIYRNKGEKDLVRPNPSGCNVFRGNSFNGYTIAFDVASRQGAQGDIEDDLAGEGRDFAYYNLFEDNTITNSLFGIKNNDSGNTIRGNIFTNVNYPIVLHDVFYSLVETTITHQPGTPVLLWMMNSQWYDYTFGGWHGHDLFDQHNQVNYGIPESQKYIHIRTDGTPNIESYSGPGTVIIADTQLASGENRAHDISGDQYVNMLDLVVLGQNWMRSDCDFDNNLCDGIDITGDGVINTKDLYVIAGDWLSGNNMKDVVAPVGKTPLDIAVGNFWQGNVGDEVAVIWNEKTTNIRNIDYYSISMYDSNGIENNRCGMGLQKLTSIVSGNFVDSITRYDAEAQENVTTYYSGDEIAAISSTPDTNGCYPIYILSYSRQKPIITLFSTNTIPIKAMAAGDFSTGDNLDELAIILTGGTSMKIYKPTTGAYLSQITVAANIKDIVGGNFHQTYTGDEIAGISDSNSLIYFYRVALSSGYWKTAGVAGGNVWANIAGGNFYSGTYTRDEVAVTSSVAANGIYKIFCYQIDSTTPVKEINQDVLGVSVRALDAGILPIGKRLGLYERALGFYSNNYTTAMSSWGESVVVLPSAPQTTATPVFWLNAAPSDNTKQYLKVTPIVR